LHENILVKEKDDWKFELHVLSNEHAYGKLEDMEKNTVHVEKE
jgi:hypothetical protein